MVATSGARLLRPEDAIETLKRELLPLATVLTPEYPGGRDPLRADHHGRRRGHGGRRAQPSARRTAAPCSARAAIRSTTPTTCSGATARASWFRGKRIDNPNTHGTGCTLSSAIAVEPRQGLRPRHVRGAREGVYLRRARRDARPRPRLRPDEPHVRRWKEEFVR